MSDLSGLRSVLRPQCPPIETLAMHVNTPGSLPAHLAGCLLCRAELERLREFELAHVQPAEAFAVKAITLKLAQRRKPKKWESKARVWAAAACLLLTAGSISYFRSTEPAITGGASQTMRSLTVKLIAPAGDLDVSPSALRWEPFDGASGYRVMVREVDRTLLWQTTTSATAIEIPAALAQSIAPGKTLLWQVTASGLDGRELASSPAQHFRLMPQGR